MTPDSLYAALDCENADIDLILGQIADWYEERGETWKAECLQWCRREGKRPGVQGWSRDGEDASGVPRRVFAYLPCNSPWWITEQTETVCDHAKLPGAYQRLADAWHALRTRGEVPVAGMTEEVAT